MCIFCMHLFHYNYNHTTIPYRTYIFSRNITSDCHTRISVVVYRHIFSGIVWVSLSTFDGTQPNRTSNQIYIYITVESSNNAQYRVCVVCCRCDCKFVIVQIQTNATSMCGNRNKWAGNSTIAFRVHVGEREKTRVIKGMPRIDTTRAHNNSLVQIFTRFFSIGCATSNKKNKYAKTEKEEEEQNKKKTRIKSHAVLLTQ